MKTLVNLVVLAVIATVVLVPLTCAYSCYRVLDAPPAARKAERSASFDASAEAQEAREGHIREMFRQGLWEKTEVFGTLPKVWIKPAFTMMDEKFQNQSLEIVYAYWMGQLDDFGDQGFFWSPLVLKIDNGTLLGRNVGSYTPIRGIEYD